MFGGSTHFSKLGMSSKFNVTAQRKFSCSEKFTTSGTVTHTIGEIEIGESFCAYKVLAIGEICHR